MDHPTTPDPLEPEGAPAEAPRATEPATTDPSSVAPAGEDAKLVSAEAAVDDAAASTNDVIAPIDVEET